MADEVQKGLEDVYVAETELSYIDGQRGELRYRGYSIQELAQHASFEEVIHLLWNGTLPTASELQNLKSRLADYRPLSEEMHELLETMATRDVHPMVALRTALSMIPVCDPDYQFHPSCEPTASQGDRILAAMPTILAAYDRYRRGEPPVSPNPELDFAENFLYMLTGSEPSELAARTFDQALVLHADHGYNASTFTAVVIASTCADMYSAVTGGIGALSGPLHGGANQDVMEMLIEIDNQDINPADWVKQVHDRGRRIPGFGHRVYKVKDPRAEILEARSRELADIGESKWYEYTAAIESYLTDELNLDEEGIAPNVDFYSGSVYYQLGIPADMYTPIFAMSRATGWIAHVLEYQQDNRLIRPVGKYTGPTDASFVPLDQR